MRKALSLLAVVLGLAVGSFAQTTTTFPKVVATFHRANQTDVIPMAAIFTPKTGGFFRFTVYGAVTKANPLTNGNTTAWEPTVTFTDDTGDVTLNDVLSVNRQSSGVLTESSFWDRAGVPISFGVNSIGDVSGTEYNVIIVVEQLM
jgi:hypothetical protein